MSHLAYEWVCPICERSVYRTPHPGMVRIWGELADHEWVVEPQVNYAMFAWGLHIRDYHADVDRELLGRMGGRIVGVSASDAS